CQRELQTKDEAQKFGLRYGLNDIGELGFNSSETNYSQFRSEYCSETGYSDRYRVKTVSYVKRVNPAVAQTLAECIARPGLHLWLEQSANPMKFRLRAKWSSNRRDA